MPDITRRSILTTGALGVGAVALAACSNSSGGSSGAEAGAGGGSTASQPAGSGASAGSSSSSSAAGIIALADVPVGGSASAKSKVNGKPCVVSQKTAGEVKAFSAICTHQGCTVKPAGAEFHCPCHGSKYDAFTGAVIQGPAPSPLPSIAVQVSGGEVVAT